MDLGKLQVQRLIVHEVPKRKVREGGQPPLLSERESPLQDDIKAFFRSKIIGTLTSRKAFDVTLGDGSTSPVPGLVKKFLQDADPRPDLVAPSKQVAQHLYMSQTGVNPAGLLTLVAGQLGQQRAVALLKLEKEQGARAHLDTVEGQRTFTIEHLRELMLTEGTRVFKASLFWWNDPAQMVEGIVSDEQQGYVSETDVADFFLTTFLGCKLAHDPRRATRDVFVASQDFINGLGDPVIKTRYHQALLVEMNSNAASFDPATFAQTHFEINDRKPYVESLEKQNAPTVNLLKDVDLIRTQIRKVQMEFDSGAELTAPPALFEDSDTLTVEKEGVVTKVTIRDTLKELHGK